MHSEFPLMLVVLPGGAAAAHEFAGLRSVESIEAATVAAAMEALPCDGHALVCAGPELDADGVRGLVHEADQRDCSLGFLDGWRGDDAGRAHARAVVRWAPSPVRRVAIWDDEPDADPYVGDGILRLCGRSNRSAKLLNLDAEILGIVSHGNGLEVLLGDGYLCAKASAARWPDPEQFLPCGTPGGKCIRARLDDGDPQQLREPERLDARSLPGDLVILGSCYATLLPGAAYGGKSSLRAGLLSEARPRQLIAPLGGWGADSGAVLAATIAARRGQPFGEITRDLNRADAARVHTPPAVWLLFGDPRLSFATTDATGARPVLDDVADIGAAGARLAEFQMDAHESGSCVFVVSGRHDPRRWIAPAGARRVVSLATSECERVEVRPYAREEQADLRALRRMWTAVPDLQFTDALFRLAGQSSYLQGFEYPEDVSADIASIAADFTTWYLHTRPRDIRVVYADDLARIAAEHGDRWRSLAMRLHELLVQFIESGGGVLGHVYEAVLDPAVKSANSGATCPYCGAGSSFTSWGSPLTAHRRTVVHCPNCTNISDVPKPLTRAVLRGPARVHSGESASWELDIETSSTEVQGVASIVLQRQGLARARDPGSPCLFNAARTPLGWTVDPTLETGAYFLLGVGIIDGAPFVARRPVRVVRTSR